MILTAAESLIQQVDERLGCREHSEVCDVQGGCCARRVLRSAVAKLIQRLSGVRLYRDQVGEVDFGLAVRLLRVWAANDPISHVDIAVVWHT
jgi:hypothetical protein